MINVMMDNLSNVEFKIDNNYIHVPATLVIAPSHICNQWKSEINRFTNGYLKPIVITTIEEHDKYMMDDLIDPRVILITSNSFIAKNYTYNYLIYHD